LAKIEEVDEDYFRRASLAVDYPSCPHDQSILKYTGKDRMIDINSSTKPFPIVECFVWNCQRCKYFKYVKLEKSS
jgi:hypothetical protein